MIMLELTYADNWDKKFMLRADLIESLHPIMGNRCEIITISGRHYTSLESADYIRSRMAAIQAEGENHE